MLEMLLPEYTRQLMENHQNIFSQMASQLRWLHFDDSSRLVTRVGFLDDGWIRLRLDGHWEFTGELLRELSWTFYNVAESNRLLESLAGALSSRATDSLRVSVVSALPESPFNLARVAGTALTGRDWSSDFARLQNLDVALSSRASENTLTLVRNLISDIDIGLSGYNAVYPRHDSGQWIDSTTYTVTETTWTEKTRLSYRPRSTRNAGYFIRFVIWGQVSAPGQTMYVRVRSGHRGVLGAVTFTETSPALREIRVYYQKALWWDDPFIFEAQVGGAGQTGYITYVDANFIPVEGLIHGISPDLSDLKAMRVDTEGILLQGLNKIGGAVLTPRDWSLDFARLQNLDALLSSRASESTLSLIKAKTDNLDVTLSALSRLIRWGRDASPAWVHGGEVTAPATGTALVSWTVPAGKTGFIYGFFISAGEGNDFRVNWTSGGVAYSRRIVFPGKGTLQYVDVKAFNEGLPADADSSITITNVNAGSAGIVYQAALLVVAV